MKRAILLLLCASAPLFAASPTTKVETVRSEARRSLDGRYASILELDRNEDGVVDQVVFLDSRGEKVHEELDYNFDGKMDDFCFYSGGVLIREEIDTNFDGHIDAWIYIKKGIYIERYERDTDHDGVIDRVKKYGPDR